MNSFMSWVGGKKSLRDAVLARFPPYYERYIEVFGGAGWVLFHKPPGNDFEVYNDFNSNLVNLYRCVRDNPNKLKYKLRYVLDSRQDFEWIASLHKRGLFPRFRDYDRAAKFYQLVRYSYASGLDSFGSQPHSIGWIYVPDTNINYPIMQGKDNDFYLTHGTDGRSLKCGCIELDYRCENRFQNNFNILYGHNMKNGSMFANVCRFKEKSYYDSHPYGWVYTSDAVYRLDFFSVAVTDWHDEIYNGYREVSEWIPRLKEISRIYENMELTEQDRLVLLSTCSYEFDNARTVLTGRLVEMEGDVNE